jgi:carboxyl-terminal processing protease
MQGGRTVYGGGGITPDEAYETPKLDKLQVELFRSGLFNFTRSYFASHSANLSKGWMPDEVVLTELYAYLKKQGTNFTDGDFTKDRDWIKRYLAKEMYTTAFNVDESDLMFARTDPEVDRAIELLPKAGALLETAKKVTQQRIAGQIKP